MNVKFIPLFASCLLVASPGLAQQIGVFNFQQVGTLTVTGSQPQMGEIWQSQLVAGKPYSATVVTRTVQTFANGTKVDHTETGLVFRDTQGRTRHESNSAFGNGTQTFVTIDDPVEGIERNYRVPQQGEPAVGRGGQPYRRIYTSRVLNPNVLSTETRTAGLTPYQMALQMSDGRKSKKGPNPTGGANRQGRRIDVEDLGAQTVNGERVEGVRITETIAPETIGNDRELQVITERWVSMDLQVLIKSVYSDPRFGTTTYELTNISRTPPNPALFQVPPGYEEGGKRGGGGGGGFPGTKKEN